MPVFGSGGATVAGSGGTSPAVISVASLVLPAASVAVTENVSPACAAIVTTNAPSASACAVTLFPVRSLVIETVLPGSTLPASAVSVALPSASSTVRPSPVGGAGGWASSTPVSVRVV